jgi:hypothetical protein
MTGQPNPRGAATLGESAMTKIVLAALAGLGIVLGTAGLGAHASPYWFAPPAANAGSNS